MRLFAGIEVEPMRVPVRALTLFESLPYAVSTRYDVRHRVPLRRRTR
jgi:hypothetical protein